LSGYLPQLTLKGKLDKGETPLTPSYKDIKRDIAIVSAEAGANQTETGNSYDDNELSEWANDGQLSTAWITYTLAEKASVDDICIKLNGWRSRSYPLEVYAGNELIWSGNTEKSLGYVHLEVDKPVRSDKITVRLKGSTTDKDAFGQIVEVAGGVANDMEKKAKANKGKHNLRIIEIEFLESIKE
jgi:beta-galactosidase